MNMAYMTAKSLEMAVELRDILRKLLPHTVSQEGAIAIALGDALKKYKAISNKNTIQ